MKCCTSLHKKLSTPDQFDIQRQWTAPPSAEHKIVEMEHIYSPIGTGK